MMAGMHIEGVPEDAADRLRDLLDTNDELTTDAVLEDAVDENSPLHRYFEWDDTEAAAKYREVQAGRLIRRVRVVWKPTEEAEPIKVRAFVSTHDLDEGVTSPTERGAYRPAETIVDAQANLLRHIQREIDRLIRKYKDVEEFGDLLQGAIDAMDDEEGESDG